MKMIKVTTRKGELNTWIYNKGKYLLLIFSLLFFAFPFSVQGQNQIGEDIEGEAAYDGSGYSVSMPDGNTIAIGAPYNDGNGDDSGHVRVYERDGNTWVQKGIDIDGEVEGDESGWSVSMPDANTVAIGARLNSDNETKAGHVRIFNWDGSTWVQKGGDIDGDAFDESGWSVSMPDANTVAIGAYTANKDDGFSFGKVRIYSWDSNAWVQKGNAIVGESSLDRSGWSVSMPDGNTVAIGAPYNDGNGDDAGHVRIYEWDGSTWIQKGADIDGEASGDFFGHSVSMPDGSTIAVGAPRNEGNGYFAGHVRVYEWDGSVWIQKGADIDGKAEGNRTGSSVSMVNSEYIAIGAPGNQVRIFSWDGSTWIQEGVDIKSEADDNFGRVVSMPDTNTVAIGASGNDGNGIGSGHVKIYNLSSTQTPTSVEDILETPNDFALNQNHPNPFNPSTVISYQLPENSEVRIEVFDMLGQKVSTLVDDRKSAGKYRVNFDAGSLASGMYIYKIRAGDFTDTKKLMLIK